MGEGWEAVQLKAAYGCVRAGSAVLSPVPPPPPPPQLAVRLLPSTASNPICGQLWASAVCEWAPPCRPKPGRPPSPREWSQATGG